MKRGNRWTVLAACGLIVLAAVGCEREVEMKTISREQAEQLTRWLLPLPKELRFDGLVSDSAAGVQVRTDEEAELVQCAAAELKTMLGDRQKEEGFPICIGTKSSPLFKDMRGIPDLDSVNNTDQAYAIVPMRGSRESAVTGIALIGRTPTGAYYAAKTFMQLIEGATAPAKDKSAIGLPIVTVRDWPDLEERGEWGGSANQDIEWMAERKMNLVESHVKLSIKEQGRGVAEVPDGLIERSKRHAVKLVPIITHLEQLPGDVFARFPELKGVGDPAAWRKVGFVTPACFSQPKLQELLTDWFICLAQVPEVTDVNVWLSENDVQCACDKCKAMNQFVLETQVVLRAWEAAKKARPDLGLRILLTQGSYKSNDKVLAAVPKGVGITYYDGGKTYNSNQEPMIYPLLEKYAADGGWLGCYPQLTVAWRVVCPWSGPQFIRYRMTEFVNKKLKCLCGYATPSNRFYDFNVTAAAEWSWNSTGRSEREFALAWATRRKLSDPEKAADWAVMLGAVGWNVYGAHVPYPWFFGRIPRCTNEGFPPFGQEPFTYIKSEKEIDENLAACEKAMTLAKAVNAPELICETQVITGYVQMLKGFYELSKAIAKKKQLSDDEKKRAAETMKLVNKGTDNVVDGLKKWQQTVAPDISAGRVADTVRVTEETTGAVADILVKLGVADPEYAYRAHRIGGWQTEDFAATATVQKKWDVTPYVIGAGKYQVHFLYDRGWSGLRVDRVALASADPKAPETLTEAACDKHVGSIGYSPKDDLYTLDLKAHDPKLKYFVIADVHGSDPKAPEDKRPCNGMVIMRKMK